MKIEFYVPEYQGIPIQLRVKVDNTIDVYYRRLSDTFGWEFKFFKSQGVTLEMATAIIDEIVRKMIWQSYDHGAQWRETGSRKIVDDEWNLNITVFFKVRDAG